MVIVAWLLTIIAASPQAIIFRVLKHPVKEFYQCTTFNFFESLSTEEAADSIWPIIFPLTKFHSYERLFQLSNRQIESDSLKITIGNRTELYLGM